MTQPAITSTADVATDRPARYAKQLTSHLGRRAPNEWSDAAGEGWIEFETCRATLTCAGGALRLSLVAEPGTLDLWEHVVGGHLARFGSRDELVVSWARSDGSAGTEQRSEMEEPVH